MPESIDIQSGRGKIKKSFYTKEELDSFSFADGDRFMERLFDGAASHLNSQLDELDSNLGTLDTRLSTQEGKMSDLETSLSNLGEDLTTLDTYLDGIDTHITNLDNILGDPPDSATFFSSIVTNQAWIDQLVANQAWLDNLFVNNAYADRITANEVKAGEITSNEINTNELATNSAFIGDLVAGQAWIDTLTANTGWFDELTSNQAFIDDIFANNITVTNVIQSSNYSSGSAGFSIDGNTGSAEFNNIIVRGDVFTTNGSIGDLEITNEGITNGSSGFAVNDNGFSVFGGSSYIEDASYNLYNENTGIVGQNIIGELYSFVNASTNEGYIELRSRVDGIGLNLSSTEDIVLDAETLIDTNVPLKLRVYTNSNRPSPSNYPTGTIIYNSDQNTIQYVASNGTWEETQ